MTIEPDPLYDVRRPNERKYHRDVHNNGNNNTDNAIPATTTNNNSNNSINSSNTNNSMNSTNSKSYIPSFNYHYNNNQNHNSYRGHRRSKRQPTPSILSPSTSIRSLMARKNNTTTTPTTTPTRRSGPPNGSSNGLARTTSSTDLAMTSTTTTPAAEHNWETDDNDDHTNNEIVVVDYDDDVHGSMKESLLGGMLKDHLEVSGLSARRNRGGGFSTMTNRNGMTRFHTETTTHHRRNGGDSSGGGSSGGYSSGYGSEGSFGSSGGGDDGQQPWYTSYLWCPCYYDLFVQGGRGGACDSKMRRRQWNQFRNSFTVYLMIAMVFSGFVMVIHQDLSLLSEDQHSIDPNAKLNNDTTTAFSSSSSSQIRQQQNPSSYLHTNLQKFKLKSHTTTKKLSRKSLAKRMRPLQNLTDLTIPYNPEVETPYFWEVALSGESVAKRVFAHCHELVQACDQGRKQPHYDEDVLATFTINPSFPSSQQQHQQPQRRKPQQRQQPHLLANASYVNVDLSTLPGILHASSLDLASSHLADVIISSPHSLYSTTKYLFTEQERGRMFAFFRHPIDRAVGWYWHVGHATWDHGSYREDVGSMTLMEYYSSEIGTGSVEEGEGIVDNPITRMLVEGIQGKGSSGSGTRRRRRELTNEDLQLAKEIVQTKCLVGLYRERMGSLARFDRYFGWGSSRKSRSKSISSGGSSWGVLSSESEDGIMSNNKKEKQEQKEEKEEELVGVEVIEETEEQRRKIQSCRKVIIRKGDKTMTHNLVVKEGSEEWDLLSAMNEFDMELYRHVEAVYDYQGEKIFNVV